MDFLPVIICFFSGLAVSQSTIPLIRRLASHASARASSFHQTHKVPIPRIGGLAFASAFIVVSIGAAVFSRHSAGWLQNAIVIFVTSLAMFGLGFWDDLRALGATKKLIGQILIATVAYVGGVQIERFQVPLLGTAIHFGIFSGPVTVFWLVGLTNLINLIDGIDGLAAGVGFMLMSLIVVVGIRSGLAFSVLCATGLAGALLGFLRYNFPPAKIYMGDGGAYFIGFVIGVLTIVNSQKGTIVAALIAPLFALALPIIDVTTAILRRGLRGLPIFRADRKHIHHRLLARGLSRRKTVIMLYVVSLVCLAFAFAVFCLKGVWLPFVFGAFGLTMLLAGHCIDFGRDYLALGRVLGNSVDLRKDSRYALPLVTWLELEAERVGTIDELWSGFEFLCRKFRFSRVTLGGALKREWQLSPAIVSGGEHEVYFEMPLNFPMNLRFACDAAVSKASFDLLSELAAEAWFKALQRWQRVHSLPSDQGGKQLAPPVPEVLPVATTSPA